MIESYPLSPKEDKLLMSKTEGTYFKEEVESIIKRYGNLSVYETIGALEVVKANLLDQLKLVIPKDE